LAVACVCLCPWCFKFLSPMGRQWTMISKELLMWFCLKNKN
jgi:hypothetical protein